MDQKIEVVAFGDRRATLMPVLLIFAVKLKTLLTESRWMMLHPQILVFMPGFSLAPTGFEGARIDTDRDAICAA